MTSNSIPERYIITLNNGLIQAHIVDNGQGEIKLDGNGPQDETCQFYFHGRFDTSHGQPQCVHRFESVKYHGYNLFWNWNGDCKVTLKNDNGDLASCKSIWWTVPDCQASTECPDLTSGLQLLKPFDFPQIGQTFPFVLVFDTDAHLTDQLSSVVKNGQFKLDKIPT